MSYYNRRKLIINEEEKVKILSLYGLLTEDLEEPSKQMTINGNSFFKNGMWKNMSQEGMSQLTKQLEKATEFLKDNLKQGMVVSVKINAGESRVTNRDNDSPGSPEVAPLYLSEKRAETMKKILTDYFNSLFSKKIISVNPIFEKPYLKLGDTSYTKKIDNPKNNKYDKDRFVNVEIKLVSVPEKKQCVNNMEIVIYYDDAKAAVDDKHVCNSSIYNIFLNDEQLTRKDGKKYASLNNDIKNANEKLKPYDNLPNIQGGSRSNTFIITPEIADKILEKNDKVLTLNAQCINPTGLNDKRWGYGCHTGVGNIRVTNGKGDINSYQSSTPNGRDEVKTIATFDSCGNPLVTQ